MPSTSKRKGERKGKGRFSFGDQKAAANEVAHLVTRYVVQETVQPLKALAKRAIFSLAAGAVLAIAFVAFLIGGLRALQTETGTTFSGTWSFAPYLLTGAAAVVVIALSAAIGLRSRAGRDT